MHIVSTKTATGADPAREIITSDKQQLGEILALAVEAEIPLAAILILVAVWAKSDSGGMAVITQPQLRLVTGLSLRGIQHATNRIPDALLRRSRPPKTGRMGRSLRYEVATPEHRILRIAQQPPRRGLSAVADVLAEVEPRQLALPGAGVCAAGPLRAEVASVAPVVQVPAPARPVKPKPRPAKRTKPKASKRTAKRGRKGGAR